MSDKCESPYFNVFTSFTRGSIEDTGDKKTNENKTKQQQLENNISRAFFSTLCHLSKEIKTEFLKETVCETLDVKIGSLKNFKVIIQHPKKESLKELEKEIIEKKNKKHIVIRGFGEFKEEIWSEKEEGEKSIPDGWILFDDTVVCVEAKLLSKPAPEQLDGQCEYWFKDSYKNINSNNKYLSWEDIETKCRAISETCSEKDKFLLLQLADFLENDGFGKLTKDLLEISKNLGKDSDNSDYNYLRVHLKKLKYQIEDKRHEKGEWKDKLDKANFQQVYIKKSFPPADGISLNVFLLGGSLRLSLYAFNGKGFEYMNEKLLNQDINKKLLGYRDKELFLNTWIECYKKVPRGAKHDKRCKEEELNSEELGNRKKVKERFDDLNKEKEKWKREYKNVGKRASLQLRYGDDFWGLKTYEKQVEKIIEDLNFMENIFESN